jgi:hypothetical protein
MNISNLMHVLVTKMIAHSSNNSALSMYSVVDALVSLAGRWMSTAPG